jgi:outer membrane receptor protein involved in Fe transport
MTPFLDSLTRIPCSGWRSTAALALALALGATQDVAAQQTGRIVGRVTTAESGAPLGEVQIFIPGTGIGTLSRQNGTFIVLEVPAGSQQVRAERIGLGAVTQQITVTAGQAVEMNFTMATQALGLDEIVVTGTAGAARRREVGSTIAQINVAAQVNRPTQSVELLQAAAPGLQVTSSNGALGGGYTIRLRGNTSVSMSNQPIFYIDGVRMQSKAFPVGSSNASGTSGGGAMAQANPLNSINPSDIERIEVIKGSAASTLYGTEASAGVIQIFTKRGSSGAPVWNLETQHSGARALEVGPELFPHQRMDPWLKTGYSGTYSGSVRGGGQALQYFTSALREGSTGTLPLDSLGRWNVRGNFTFTPISSLQLQWNSGYASTTQRNTPANGAAGALMISAYRGFGNYFGSENPEVIKVVLDQDFRREISRFTTGATATFTPIASLTNRLSIGFDYSNQENREFRPFGFPIAPLGSITTDVWQNKLLTVDYVGTFALDLAESVRSSFSWGGQTVGEDTRRVNAYGEGFPGAAAPTVSSAATNVAAEDRSKVWNAGFFLQNVLDLSNRYFVTVGMRVDGNSAFGSGFGLQMYPKGSVSWVLSDEPFWSPGWGSIKVRAAYGQSGRAPGAFDAVRTWRSQAFDGRATLVPGNLGDVNIGPEVTAEVEAGVDAEWLDGRLTAAFTYFNQTTTDALFSVALIPSSGFTGSQRQNVGKLGNTGLELNVEGSPIDGASWGVDLGLNIATNKSEVIDLGGIPPFATGGGWVETGKPVPAIQTAFVRNGEKPFTGTLPLCTAAAAVADPTLSCVDLNHFYGPAQPTLIWSPTATLRAPAGVVLAARGEFRGGNYTTDSNFLHGGVSRGAWMVPCWDYYANPYDGTRQTPAYAPPTPQHTLALKPGVPANWAGQCTPTLSREGFNTRKADYFKLRSVSAQIPVDFAFPDRVNNASLTLAVNNAWRWLNEEWEYGDPEWGTATDGLLTGRPTLAPPPTYTFNASLRVQF